MPGVSSLQPFKPRPDLDALSVAQEMFGQPQEVTGSTDPPRTEMLWHFYDDHYEVTLLISQLGSGGVVDITFSSAAIRPEDTLFGQYTPGRAQERLKIFIESVRKPWSLWTEQEIEDNPMWICLYREAGHDPTPAMENRMVMESYAEPDSRWVKRYFRVSDSTRGHI